MILTKKLKQMLELLLLGLSSKYAMDYFKKGAVTVPKPMLHSQKSQSLNYKCCVPIFHWEYTNMSFTKDVKG